MVEVPVFVVNGFLESGKTSLIKEIIESNSDVQKLDTLIIMCEDGEVEYDQKFLDDNKVHLEKVSSQDELTKDYLLKLDAKYEPARVVIEFNSFFKFEKLELPEIYVIGQVITLIDASTFKIYFNNMKQIFNDMVKDADLIIFNRADGNKELASYRRLIRAFSKNAQIAFENKDGELSETLVEDLPYDLTKDKIDIKEKDYATFYMDCYDNYQRYFNKEISFIAQLEELDGIDDFSRFLPGRKIMTCCAQDIRFYGFETVNDLAITFNRHDYAKITVRVTREHSDQTGKEEVILHLIGFNKIQPLGEDDVLSLT